ncbi:unnamed protein product [Sphagnum balticum]
MHMEATGRDALLSVSSLLGQLAQLVQTGNFDEYVRSFRDLVDELASSAELPTRLMLRQMFIGGLDKDENRAWKEKYLLTSEANSPATYEIVIEDIRSYHMQRISLGIITEATNQKGSTRDGDVQANAAGPQPQQGTRKGKKNPVRAPPALRGTPHLNYALQQGDAFGAMIRIVPDTELHRVPYGINISPRDWHNANRDNESTESEDGSVRTLSTHRIYAGIDTVNLLSLDLWEQHDMRYVKSRDIITVYSPDNRIILTSTDSLAAFTPARTENYRTPAAVYTRKSHSLHPQQPLRFAE